MEENLNKVWWDKDDKVVRLLLSGKHGEKESKQIILNLSKVLSKNNSTKLIVDSSNAQVPNFKTFKSYISFLNSKPFLRVAFVGGPFYFRYAIFFIYLISSRLRGLNFVKNDSEAKTWVSTLYSSKNERIVVLFIFVFLLLISILVTYGFFYFEKEKEESNSYNNFLQKTQQINVRVSNLLDEHVSILTSAKALVDASDFVDRKEWNIFINSQEDVNHRDAIRAFELVDKVDQDSLEFYVKSIRNDKSFNNNGYPSFSIKPNNETEEYYIVNYIEPFDENIEAFGFNLFSNPSRKEAIEIARDNNTVVITEPISLIQDGKTAFLMLVPFYKGETETLNERRQNIKGVVLAVVDTGKLFSLVHEEAGIDENLFISLSDVTNDNNAISILEKTLEPYPKDAIYNFEETTRVNFGSRVWEITIKSTDQSDINLISIFSILILGTLLSAFVSLTILNSIKLKTEAENLAKMLVKDLEKFKLAADTASDMIVISDADGNVIYANPATEKITEYKIEDALGKKAGALWGGIMDKSFFQEMWETIKVKKQVFTGEIKNKRKGGEEYISKITISPISDELGDIKFFVSIERDVTEERKYNELLKDISSRLTLATESAKIGVWEWNIKTNELKWDDQMYVLYGVKKEDFSGAYDAWSNGLHPEDKERSEREIQSAIKEGKRFDTEFRVVWPNKSVHYIKAAGMAKYDSKGDADVMVGVNWDITKEKDIDKAKSEFVSVASHQLRTPMTAIRWVVERFMKKEKLTKKGKEYLNDIHTSVESLADLVDSLLNVSRIEGGGGIGVYPKELDAVSFIEEYISETNPLLEKKKLKLTFTEHPNSLKFVTDPMIFRNIVQSLVSNAIEYTPDGGSITLTLKEEGQETILFTVGDTGIGIPEKEQDQIFQKFHRADNARLTKPDGSGLGLYITREAVKLLGGSITFISKENEGTTFRVVLPRESKTKEGDKALLG